MLVRGDAGSLRSPSSCTWGLNRSRRSCSAFATEWLSSRSISYRAMAPKPRAKANVPPSVATTRRHRSGSRSSTSGPGVCARPGGDGLGGRRRLLGRVHAVADATDRLDHALEPVLAQLAPQVSDVDVDDVGQPVVGVVPDVVEHVAPGDDLALAS